MIFRVDDISPSTDYKPLMEMYDFLNKKFNYPEIISVISPIGHKNKIGSVCPNLPLKENLPGYFVKTANDLNRWEGVWLYKIASHGLFHFDHTKLGKEYQRASIRWSCDMLNTKKFVAPFNKYNMETMEVCKEEGITLLNTLPWKSIEFNEFDETHDFWYFHPWRWDFRNFKRAIEKRNYNLRRIRGDSVNMGQLQTGNVEGASIP